MTKKAPHPKPGSTPPYIAALKSAKQRRFLSAFRRCGLIAKSCEASEVSRTAVAKWRKSDERFADAFAEAREDAIETLEEVARRLATVGEERKKFTAQGEPIIDPETGTQYVEREVSVQALMFMLKSLRPDVYREKHELKHTGPDGGPVQVIAATHNQIMSSPDLYAQVLALAEQIDAGAKPGGSIPSVETE